MEGVSQVSLLKMSQEKPDASSKNIEETTKIPPIKLWKEALAGWKWEQMDSNQKDVMVWLLEKELFHVKKDSDRNMLTISYVEEISKLFPPDFCISFAKSFVCKSRNDLLILGLVSCQATRQLSAGLLHCIWQELSKHNTNKIENIAKGHKDICYINERLNKTLSDKTFEQYPSVYSRHLPEIHEVYKTLLKGPKKRKFVEMSSKEVSAVQQAAQQVAQLHVQEQAAQQVAQLHVQEQAHEQAVQEQVASAASAVSAARKLSILIIHLGDRLFNIGILEDLCKSLLTEYPEFERIDITLRRVDGKYHPKLRLLCPWIEGYQRCIIQLNDSGDVGSCYTEDSYRKEQTQKLIEDSYRKEQTQKLINKLIGSIHWPEGIQVMPCLTITIETCYASMFDEDVIRELRKSLNSEFGKFFNSITLLVISKPKNAPKKRKNCDIRIVAFPYYLKDLGDENIYVNKIFERLRLSSHFPKVLTPKLIL